ncbi:MAG TPA: TIGR01777 family oxidoreductase [Candidatus Acidoferrales bacterium]|nr:TIGR01777 family oxidoreductase [Candidatus Acidoferrales bacterium]
MKIIVSGASGLIGTALTRELRAERHDVRHLVRSGSSLAPHEIRWDPPSARVNVPALEGADAVVHLSGASISDGRWTEARKQVLRSSRIDSTRVLVDSLMRLQRPPKVFVCASAIGYYGNRGDEILTESSGPGRDFLSLLARDWEAEANRAAQAGIRTPILRFGVILSAEGGALPEMIRPFKFGVGGRIGSGRQWISWIALEDVIRIIQLAIADAAVHGPVNVVAPEPVRNAEFARMIGKVLHRPALLPAPKFALRLALGEMADALLLTSQRVIPEQLLKANFGFRYEDLESALHAILGAS